MSSKAIHELDEMMLETWASLVARLAESPKGEPFELSPPEKELLLSKLRTSVDISRLMESIGEILASTLIPWRERPERKKR